MPRRSITPRLTVLEDRSTPATFTAGSIQGQDGWSGGAVDIRPEVSQGVDQTGTFARQGVGAFVLSNRITPSGDFNGGFAGWPVSPALSVAAGQPSSLATADTFTATIWFRSVSTTADGSNIEIDLGLSDGSDRNSYIGLANYSDTDPVSPGLRLYFSEPQGNSGNLYSFEYSGPLTRGVWHRIDMTARFIDGSANDVITLSIDGTPFINPATNAPEIGTLEGYYEGTETPYTYGQTSRLMLRSGFKPSDVVTGASDTGAAGFAFDDISYFTSNSAAPATKLASYSATFEPKPNLVYSNPSFAALPDGTVVSDANPNLPGNQSATVGTDAFGTLTAAANAVAPGGQIFAFPVTTTGTATIPNGVTLNPGGTNGAASVGNTGSVLFNSGATFAVDLLGPTVGSQYDRLTVAGTADIGGSTLLVNAGYVPAPADSFTILEATSVAGQFAGLPDGATVAVGGYSYKVRYTPTAVRLELDRADLSVSITDNLSNVVVGQQVTYTVVVRNDGPRAVTGAVVGLNPPAGLTNMVFGSVANGGATGNGGGAGPMVEFVNMPVGSVITYTVTGTVGAAAVGGLTVTVAVATPQFTAFDPVSANNVASDTDTVTPPDTTPPTVAVVPAAPLVVGTPVTLNITFSEPVTGFTPAQLGLANATLGSFGGSGTTYFAVITPTASNVTVGLPAGAGRDAAGNPSVLLLASLTAAAPVTPTPTPTASPRYVAAVGNIITVYNPADNSSRQFNAFPGYGGPVTVATGDLTGDGVPEVAVGAGAGGGPHVRLFDGASGAELASFFAYDPAFTGGVYVAIGGGRIVTGAGAGGGPHVKVIDGTKLNQKLANGQIADSALVGSFFAYDPAFTGGVRVATGDLNSDGVADVAVAAGVGGGPHVKVVDGTKVTQVQPNGVIADTALMANFFAFDAGYSNGLYVAVGGGQVIVGSGENSPPVVKGFDRTGRPTFTTNAYDTAFTGGVRVAVNDVNGDGVPDLVTGAGPGGGVHVRGFALPSLTPSVSFFVTPLPASATVRFGSDGNQIGSVGVYVA